jgi:hypothetical protein
MSTITRLRALEAKIYAADTQEANKYAGQLQDEINRVWPKLLDALEVARYFLDEKELLMSEYYRVRGDEEKFKVYQEKEKQWRDALAALEDEK